MHLSKPDQCCVDGPSQSYQDQLLFDALAEEPALGTYPIKVPQRGGRNARKARKVTLEVKMKTATKLQFYKHLFVFQRLYTAKKKSIETIWSKNLKD